MMEDNKNIITLNKFKIEFIKLQNSIQKLDVLLKYVLKNNPSLYKELGITRGHQHNIIKGNRKISIDKQIHFLNIIYSYIGNEND